MPLARRTYLVIALALIALAAAGSIYFRHRVDTAVAECTTPAPPDKPSTPPPNLPGFAAGEACGPGGSAAPGAAKAPDTKR